MTKPNYIIVDDLDDDAQPKVNLKLWIENHLPEIEKVRQVSAFHLNRINRILKDDRTTNNLHSQK
ncbi:MULTISPECIES: hypothetical protein [Flavobacterium]|uniref:Uncharacterized protein n=1 Tax=Flavobacterium columnare TaxID=996 RepID=A0AA94EZF0_9FLAO|nr:MULTISPECIES: hypothetical protein [Flavobacterium]MCH4828238.1 hypothetical protein [Flavobacterium columnare]MCH4828909.1 hypothetical protein [Flavobacterium columnare]MCH4829805.1 hypothetical protein [Flavobacterium columnare]MCH4831634.1 hypothetical protein [Flavobacterium columnare]MCH4831671.1 hypothetical protein [Flavobacterium columnare]